VLPAGCKTVPSDFSVASSVDFQNAFSVNFLDLAPSIKPVYGVSVDPEICGGQAALPPVTYRTWIPPHVNLVYVVRLPSSFPG